MKTIQQKIKDTADQRGFSLIQFLFVVCCAMLIILVAMAYRQDQSHQNVNVITHQQVIQKIQTLSRLQTIVYKVDSIVHTEKQGTWYKLWQDGQKGLFVVRGSVQAGVDLQKLKAEHIKISNLSVKPEQKSQGKSLEITLPATEIFETYLDKIEVYDIQTGLWGSVPLDPEIIHLAQNEAKQQILKSACESQILTLATENAQKQIQTLFELGDMQVKVIANPTLIGCP